MKKLKAKMNREKKKRHEGPIISNAKKGAKCMVSMVTNLVIVTSSLRMKNDEKMIKKMTIKRNILKMTAIIVEKGA